MRKFIAVGVLVGGLLAGAELALPPAADAVLGGQGGTGDPLQLAASGVFIPYITGGPDGLTALIEVASPFGPNNAPNIHMIFYNATCDRLDSREFPETANDILEFDPILAITPGANGLVAIAGVSADHRNMVPLQNPIHSRVYIFNSTDGRSRIFEPIIIDTAEFGLPFHHSKLWSPLRTAATFFAPVEAAVGAPAPGIHTQITFVCPRTTIQGDSAGVNDQAAFGWNVGGSDDYTNNGFPQIDPPFWDAVKNKLLQNMGGEIYDTNEAPLGDIHFRCDCLTPDLPITSMSIADTYHTPGAAHGTYTEIWVIPTASLGGSFVAYRDTFSIGSILNKFFGRMSNGSYGWITGTSSTSAR